MAIGYNTCSSGVVPSWGTTVTWSHTCGVEANRVLVVITTASSVTYGGVALTRIPSLSYAWYLINPASGANNVVAEWAGATRDVAVAADYYGVDQLFPIRYSAQNGTPATTMSVSLSCMIGDMLIGGFRRDAGDSCGNASAQSPLTNPYDCCRNSSSTVGLIPHAFQSHGIATSTPQTITVLCANTSANDLWMGTCLAPYIPAFGRGVKYYFNIWDPRATVRDRTDRPVPPNELRADNWVELQGVTLPDPKVYTTFVEDPTKAYLVEVTASDRGASLRASRNQFADTLIKRAAAGRG